MSFQRARRPEQVEARRNAILETARAMLAEQPVTDISLRELSDRVGLAKSNVLRYFDSREAIFLQILDDAWTTWLDELEAKLTDPPNADAAAYARESWIAATIAGSLVSRKLLCDLASAMAGVLERNISIDVARTFKRQALANLARLAELVGRQLPHLSADDALHFAGAAQVIVSGLWPYTNPSEVVATAMRELGMPDPAESFETNLREGLTNQLVGLSVRASVG
jgi:AcrR family transcriptional regulator